MAFAATIVGVAMVLIALFAMAVMLLMLIVYLAASVCSTARGRWRRDG